VLFALKPSARVGALIRHHVYTITLASVQFVKTFITSPIFVLLDAETVDFSVFPVACELFAIRPLVSAETFNDPVNVVSCIGLIIRPPLDSVSIALAIVVKAVEAHAIRVTFFAEPVLDSLLEQALVDEEVHVPRNSLSVLHVVGPVTFVGLALHVSELAKAMCSAQVPCSLVGCSISELHHSSSVAESVQPLAVVSGARCAELVGFDYQLRLKLSFIRIEENSQVNDASPAYCLQLVLDQKVSRLFSSFISLLGIAHSVDFGFPHGLNSDDPIHVGLEVVVEAVAVV